MAGRRDDVQVATKIWTRGRVDLEQVHNLVAWPLHLDWLEEERAAGRVGLIGATHHAASAFDELERVMRTGRIDAIQIPYNPVQRGAEGRILPLADERVHVAIPATSSVAHARVNTAAGDPPWPSEDERRRLARTIR